VNKTTLILALLIPNPVQAQQHYNIFDSNGHLFIQGNNGYAAQTFTTPSGNIFGSDSSGNSFSVFQPVPAPIAPLLFPQEPQ
jgi:hypothetical protein